MAYFDGELAEQPLIAGERFSMTDSTLFMGPGSAEIEIPERYANRLDRRDRTASRLSVVALGG